MDTNPNTDTQDMPEENLDQWWANYVWPLVPPVQSDADMVER